MRKLLTTLVAGALAFASAISVAEHHEEGAATGPATPVELFTCTYNDGQGPDDLKRVIKKFNNWADKKGMNDYTAWTMVPYYAGPEQDFDVLWLGGSPSAAALGRSQDMWLAEGGAIQAEFDAVSDCGVHANYAVLEFKKAPERKNPDNVVVSFSDCSIHDGKTFDDVYPAMVEWSKYRTEHGSTAGMWVMFPAYGGGGEEFDFKFVAAHQNLEDQGKDWDQYSESGWETANALFDNLIDCDSSRVYLATNIRRAPAGDDE